MDPRGSLDAWMMQQRRQQQQQQGRECDGVGVDETSGRTGTGMGCIISAGHSLPTMPRTLSPAHSIAPKANNEHSSPNAPEPFISQTSPIFQELIGGHATGEIEEEQEEEQGDRKVHGFVYTRQGMRRTVFRGELSETKLISIPMTKPEESVVVSLAESKRPLEKVRKYKVPRMRLREKTISDAHEDIITCKLCAAYAQLRLCEVVRAAEPDIPVMCGPCLRKEINGQSTMGEKPSRETGAAVESTNMPIPTPKLRLSMRKGPPETAAGNDQMALQMLADVQRCPKRVRRVPGRLLEA